MRPRGALAVLALPFAVLVLVWALREPTSDPCFRTPFGADERAAWLAGLGPAAFTAGCYCAAFIVWLSARTRGGEPSRATVLGVLAGLAAAGAWWAGGETVAFRLMWPVLAFLLLFPSLLVVAGLIVAILVDANERRAWRRLQDLAWLAALVVLPGYVGFIDQSGTRIMC